MILEVQENTPNISVDNDMVTYGSIRPVMDKVIRTVVDAKMKRELEKLAAADHRNISQYIRLLIAKAIEQEKSRVNDSRSKASVA
jgi:hypothetical protein